MGDWGRRLLEISHPPTHLAPTPQKVVVKKQSAIIWQDSQFQIYREG